MKEVFEGEILKRLKHYHSNLKRQGDQVSKSPSACQK